MVGNTSTRFGVPRELAAFEQTRAKPIQAGSIPRIQFSTGMAKALQDFSFSMFSMSSKFEDQLDEQAKAEGTTEGAIAGATGDFETQDYTTIRSRAFNTAGVKSFVSTLETRSIAKMSELTAKFSSDPTRLRQEFENYSEGVAREIDKVSPGAGVIYRQRQLIRSLPKVEAAKDNAFRITRDQADARLIESRVALNSELKSVSADLFSDNPERSSAAVSAIGLVQKQIMQVYDAVDPVTGKSLYSSKERAKAKIAFNETVLKQATLSWFDEQPDKAKAYIDFTSGKFKIKTQINVGKVKFIDATAGKIRSKPVTTSVKNKVSAAVTATGSGLSVMIISGGQVGKGQKGRRTGSTRHDHGKSMDMVLVRNGKKVLPGDDPALYAKFFENAAAAGFTGLGHYAWGVHVGGGSKVAWGPNTKSNTLDPVFGAAIKRGWKGGKLQTEPSSTSVDIRKTVSPKALASVETEMRARIKWSNSQADRAEKKEKKDFDDRQELNGYQITNRFYNGGKTDEAGKVIPELSRNDVTAAVEAQSISPNQGEAIIKAMNVEPAKKSDGDVYTEALRQVYEGKDITSFVFENAASLSTNDQSSLLAKNRSMNVLGEGTMSKEQQFHFNNLKDLLTPDSLTATVDPSAESRKFSALDEYRVRIGEGEIPRDVARDLSNRVGEDARILKGTALKRLIKPRFYVDDKGKPGRVDVGATYRALVMASRFGSISDAAFHRQLKLLEKWEALQSEVEK